MPLPSLHPEKPPRISRRSFFAWASRPEEDDCWIRVHRQAMACRFEILLSGEDKTHLPVVHKALDEIERVESVLTVFRPTSLLVHLNERAAQEAVPVDQELFGLIKLCSALHIQTRGAYDVTTTPLSRCWGFLKREGRLPSADQIEGARAKVGMERIELDEARHTVRFLSPGVELNFGSVGKGYALGRAGGLLRKSGLRNALLSAAGSSVLAMGGEGGDWVIDIRSRRAKARLGRLRLRDGALGTSGAGEQFVEIDGRRYGHVLDPRTGWPASSTLSASVVASDPAMADALSTAFLVGGSELARGYCEAHADTLALITPDDGTERTQSFGSYPGASVEEP